MNKAISTFSGKRLKEAREAKGWSLRELSMALYEREVNLTEATLSNYENEKTTPDIDVMAAISQVLGKNFEFFLLCN